MSNASNADICKADQHMLSSDASQFLIAAVDSGVVLKHRLFVAAAWLIAGQGKRRTCVR